MPEQLIYSADDVLGLLDSLLAGEPAGEPSAGRGGHWWDGFYADRARPIPFFTGWPDENLAGWLSQGLLAPGRVLELGCGHGRNAVFLAGQGSHVDAVDFSPAAIGWARERAAAAGAAGERISFQCCSIFDAEFTPGSYDLVYDSGCFHHLPPHRRRGYLELVMRALGPGGHLGLVCFRPEGGSGLTDQEVYERRSLGGGLGYSRERLEALCHGRLDIRQLRQMIKPAGPEHLFGEDFLWTLLAQLPPH
jgi:SAM-dependent methyltransferase